MTRSAGEIEREAKLIGEGTAKRAMDDHKVIQVLCALVEELAENVQRLERELKQIKKS